jgi:hypothetical protein
MSDALGLNVDFTDLLEALTEARAIALLDVELLEKQPTRARLV